MFAEAPVIHSSSSNGNVKACGGLLKSLVDSRFSFCFLLLLALLSASQCQVASAREYQDANVAERLYNSRLVKDYEIDYLTEYIYNFTIPKNDPTFACIKLDASISFVATYPYLSNNGSILNETINFTLPFNNFTFNGYCSEDRNSFELYFLNDWRLEFYFYKSNTSYFFNHIVLYYSFNGPLFPNSIHKGAQSEVYDHTFANATLQTSIQCESGYKIDMGEVIIRLSDVHMQAFFNKRPNLPFDNATVCPNDNPPDVLNNTNIMIPIVVFSVFVALIVASCAIYIYIKAKRSYEGVATDTTDAVTT